MEMDSKISAQNNSKAVKSDKDMSKERYISPKKRVQIITYYNNRISKNNKFVGQDIKSTISI